MQTVAIVIGRRVLRHLIWIYTVSQCHFYGAPGINGLRKRHVYNEIFNTIFDTGLFPDAWGDGFIVPLHKKASVENVENFRGITLLNVVGKLFTSVLNTHLNEWAEKNIRFMSKHSRDLGKE